MEGAIKKILLQNFVTYDAVECVPCENLNVIIGPNGTGKSTIVSAIMLGLGEKPVLTGRGKKVQEFIKTGYTEAKIVLELHPDHVVERRITADGKSVYKLNGKLVTEKDINTFTKRLNIQVGNLCQFLPQDRVSEFARMNKKELLINTEKAVGGDELVSLHNQLINMQGNSQRLADQLASMENSLATKTEQNSRLDVDIKTYTEKNNLLVEIGICKKKLMWQQYQCARNDVAEAKKEKIPKEAAVKAASEAYEPIKTKKRELELKQHQVKEKRKSTSKAYDAMEVTLKSRMEEVNDIFSKVRSLERNFKKNSEKDDSRCNQIQVLRQNIEDSKRAIAEMEASVPETRNQIKVISEELAQYGKKLTEVDYSIDEVRRNSRNLKYEKDALNAKIAKVENVHSQKLELLRRVDHDAYKGALWVQENRQMFKGNVYLPLMVELNVTDPRCASYIENAIGFNDLIAFSCENNEDVNLLTNELRSKQRLRINIFSTDVQRNVSNPPCSVEQLRRYGFDGFLDQFITVPEPIRGYLLSSKRLHTVPVSHNEISMDMELPFRRYYTDGSVVNISGSNYSSETITMVSKVKRASCLQISQSASNVEADKERLHQLENQWQHFGAQIAALTKDKERYTELCTQKRHERNAIQQKSVDLNTAKLALTRKETEVRDLERERQEFLVEKDTIGKKIQDLVKEAVKKQNNASAIVENVQKILRDVKMSKMEDRLIQKKLAVIEKAGKQHQDAVKEAKEELERVIATWNGLKDHALKCFNEAKKETEGFSPRDPEFSKFNNLFSTLPETMNELEKLIDEKTALANCKRSVNDNVLLEYQQRNTEIEQLQKSIRKKQDEITQFNSSMTSAQEEWLSSLRILVRKIGENFQKYYNEIQCAGDVVLEPGKDEHDYKNYGLSIQVSYRESAPLKELDQFTQSGGERAVATALFMISLQELTKVPFRCVDEINQGMDETNERRVYKLLMSITSRESTSQYFLLTPKLIKGIEYSETCKVHCVFNGPSVLSYKYWNLDSFIQRKKRVMDTD